MGRYTLSFTVKPGSESTVAGILTSYGRPAAGRRPGGPALLRRTSVFMAGNRVFRVVDVEGTLGEALGHLAGQPQIRAAEESLDPHLEVPRELNGAEGIRAFLERSALPLVHDRRMPAALLPEVEPEQRDRRAALWVPVRPGAGAEAAELLVDLLAPVPAPAAAPGTATAATAATAVGTVARTSVFRRDDVVLLLVEVYGDTDRALDRIARAAVRSGRAAELAGLVTGAEDLSGAAGFRAFLERVRAPALTDRRMGVPV